MPICEITIPRFAGVYLIGGDQPIYYVGESTSVARRLISHTSGRVAIPGTRMILLREVGPRSAIQRRKHERRFMAAALEIGLKLLNTALPGVKELKQMGSLEEEKQTIHEALEMLVHRSR